MKILVKAALGVAMAGLLASQPVAASAAVQRAMDARMTSQPTAAFVGTRAAPSVAKDNNGLGRGAPFLYFLLWSGFLLTLGLTLVDDNPASP